MRIHFHPLFTTHSLYAVQALRKKRKSEQDFTGLVLRSGLGFVIQVQNNVIEMESA